MVTVLPGLTLVCPPGACFVTCPLGAVEAGSGFWVTFRPRPDNWLWAAVADSPVTFGMVTCCGPVDTYRVTTVLAGTLLPPAGLVLITSPLAMVWLAWSTTFGCRCAAVTCCTALACGRPWTSGTA